jgi:hypothetical protein
MQWIGKGVLKVGSKLIGYGEEIPEGKLEEERIQQLIKKGNIGDVPKPIKKRVKK